MLLWFVDAISIDETSCLFREWLRLWKIIILRQFTIRLVIRQVVQIIRTFYSDLQWNHRTGRVRLTMPKWHVSLLGRLYRFRVMRLIRDVIFFVSYVIQLLIILNVNTHDFSLGISLLSFAHDISDTRSSLHLLGIIDPKSCRRPILLIENGLHLWWGQGNHGLLGIKKMRSATWNLLRLVVLLLLGLFVWACFNNRLSRLLRRDIDNRWPVLFLCIVFSRFCDSCFKHKLGFYMKENKY